MLNPFDDNLWLIPTVKIISLQRKEKKRPDLEFCIEWELKWCWKNTDVNKSMYILTRNPSPAQQYCVLYSFLFMKKL